VSSDLDDALVYQSNMRQALDSGDLERFLQLESAYYSNCIKIKESIDHYEKLYELIDPLVERFGGILGGLIAGAPSGGASTVRICYLLPSLDSDLAHIEVLYNILKFHPPGSTIQIFVAGYSAEPRRIGSRLLQKLERQGKIGIISFPFSVNSMVEFGRWFLRERISLLILYSIPVMLSAWVQALGAHRVAWATTKFELSSFKTLRLRIALSASQVEEVMIRGRRWRRSISIFPKSDLIQFDPRNRSQIRLLSINREEKMISREFLNAVSKILLEEPSAVFSWTGRIRDPRIVSHFESCGLVDRHQFIGWVNPMTTLSDHDIFLDTYGLSGLVAMKAFSSGMPTIFFRNSNAWPEIHENRIRSYCSTKDWAIEKTLATDSITYGNSVLQLMRSKSDYASCSAWQRDVASFLLEDENILYASHIRVIQETLRDAGAMCEAPAPT
jgi:hypothetical protein